MSVFKKYAKASWSLAILFMVATSAIGQGQPKISIPADGLKSVGGYVRFSPETDAKLVVYIALDEAYPFPSEELRDARRFILPTSGLKDGVYRFVAVATKDDVPTVVQFQITIGTGIKQPPIEPDKPIDKPIDKPVESDVYFLIVRPDGPVSQELAKVLADSAWDDHRKKGYKVKEKTLTDSKPIYSPPSGTTLPFVVTLRSGATESKVISGPVSLPTTSDGIRKLGEGVK